MRWKIFGYSFRDDRKPMHERKLRTLCIIEADCFDKAIEKARNFYGSLYVVGAQPE